MPPGEPIELIAVLDGDSIEAEVEGNSEEIRLLGINTPERDECWSQEARQATRDLTETGSLTLVSAGRDRFGRLLGYVGADGLFVNASLVATGHATAITNDHAYLDEFRDAEQAAFELGLGLWGRSACGPDLGTRVLIDRVDGNPPGRDDDPRDGESATIVNDGGETVDLSGWVLRDESSTHRYEFPSGTTLRPGDAVDVFSICGVHEHCFGEWDTVWSNGGDTALLLDKSGNVVDRLRFGG
jgi:micrococcal nuclease